jgi:hypothetical protein
MWALIFLASVTPLNYSIHSTYSSESECIEKLTYYNNAFKYADSKMTAHCRLKDKVKVRSSTIVVFKETLR